MTDPTANTTYASEPSCFFCNLPANFVLGRTEGYVVTLCSGPIVEGHILLVAPTHIAGFVDLPSDRLQGLIESKRVVRQILEREYAPCTFFEHGHHGHLRKEVHCSHAHMHVLPINVNFKAILRERGHEEEMADYGQASCGSGEYMYVEETDAIPYFFSLRTSPERRFLRKTVLKELNQSEDWANWEEFNRSELIAKTRRKLQAHFEKLTRS